MKQLKSRCSSSDAYDTFNGSGRTEDTKYTKEVSGQIYIYRESENAETKTYQLVPYELEIGAGVVGIGAETGAETQEIKPND
ncbi:MAG: hypothetical protein M3Q95_00555 [Bacteroidota bacterium]|nr:hypothetical protein [Bacteroidota bacterium]